MRLIKNIEELEERNLMSDDIFIFEDVLNLLEAQDCEFMGVNVLELEDVDKSDQVEALHILVFRIFNTELEFDYIQAKIQALSDPEFAYFEVVKHGDLIVVTAHI